MKKRKRIGVIGAGGIMAPIAMSLEMADAYEKALLAGSESVGVVRKPRSIGHTTTADVRDLANYNSEEVKKIAEALKQDYEAINRRVVAKNKGIPINAPKIQRNTQCPCGSGKKYKNCCL